MTNNPQQMLQQMLANGMSPEQIVQQMVQANPSLNQTLNQIQNMSRGQNMRDFTMQYLKQNGVDMRQVEQMAQMIGVK